MQSQAVTDAIHERKQSRREIEALLSEAGARDYHRPSFCCPFHHDDHASAAIRRSAETGAWYFYCYTCGINDDAWALEGRLTGRTAEDVLRDFRMNNADANKRPVLRVVPQTATTPAADPRNEARGGTDEKRPRVFPSIEEAIKAFTTGKPGLVVEEVNNYTNPVSGIPDLVTVRYLYGPGQRKQFLQISPFENGWAMKGLSGTSLPLFNRDRIADAQNVIVVEGEKCVRALTRLLGDGWAATTCPGGVKSAHRADWSPLAGKTVYIWPDNDEPGIVFGQEVAETVSRLPGCRLFLVDPATTGLGPKEDVADLIDPDLPDTVNISIFGTILQDAKEIRLGSDLKRRLDLIASGEYRSVPFLKAPKLTHFSQALLPGKVIVLCGEPGAGKALALDTPIPTPNGWTTMGALQVGDQVFDDGGKVCNVLYTSPIYTDHKCFEITFSDGTKVIADAEHRWLTTTERARQSKCRISANVRKREKKGKVYTTGRSRNQTHLRTLPSVVTTQEIADTVTRLGRLNHSVGVAGPLSLPHADDLPIDPYVLGVWLGDGTSTTGQITSDDAEVIARINARGYETTKQKAKFMYNITGLKAALRQAGLLNNKHIPIAYLRASYRQRLDLLQGLMDSDGSASKSGSCVFYNKNKVLMDGVRDLLGSFGIITTLRRKTAKLYGKECGDAYRLQFVTDFPAFSLSRKLARQMARPPSARRKTRQIVSCVEVPPVPVRCITVDSRSHLFLATESYIPTHNTFWILENLWMWVQDGVQVSANFLEEDMTFYQQRALAQMAGEARVLRADWVAENPAYVARLEEKYRDEIEDLSRVMICSGSEQRTVKQVSEWVAARAAAGDRIIIVDPVTAAHSETPAKDDLALMMAVKKAAEQYMCSVILVTHPRVGKAGKPGLDGMAGGAAYPRFAQTVLWLRHYEQPQEGSTYGDYKLTPIDYTRAIEIWKARDGAAASGNRCIAVELRTDNVRFAEMGVVVQNAK